ncbi:unnamed protein product [Heligmosomoides polygyrus]|uniref:Trehalase n=1 Tax=Heligmosomoides polygyrus TaxID=6339 RepID=A0A183G221_HELPZ|nr:unnamed protein product [Heligmosomoides polygyrus]
MGLLASVCITPPVSIQSLGVFEYPGGIPTSMVTDSEEQWDFPNGFSPLNHMVVEGLRKSQNAQMQDAVRIFMQLMPTCSDTLPVTLTT